jgi:dethiobiotin synthetase
MRGLFVTATDTGVGKSILSAALLAAMAATGEPVRAYKPVVTGLEDAHEIAARGLWPPDHELLAGVAGMQPERVSPLRFGPAVSPHLAAELAGTTIELQQLLGEARALAGEHTLVVEGVGGLLVPLNERDTVCDLAAGLGLPVVIAARPGLGTINHALLTLRVARSAGLNVRALVLTPWPEQPGVIERSNRETLARLGEVEVATLGNVPGPDPTALAVAGGQLPWRDWVTGRCGSTCTDKRPGRPAGAAGARSV